MYLKMLVKECWQQRCKFLNFRLSVSHAQNESFSKEINTTYQYTEFGKMSLKVNKKDLELTEGFKNEVEKAIK